MPLYIIIITIIYTNHMLLYLFFTLIITAFSDNCHFHLCRYIQIYK